MNKNSDWLDFALGMYKKLQEMGFGGPWGEANLESLINIAKQVNSCGQEKAVIVENEKSPAKTGADLFWKQQAAGPAGDAAGTCGGGDRNPCPLSIYESVRDITLQAILPGVASPKDLLVLIGDGVLRLSGTRTIAAGGGSEPFQKTIVLPAPVETSGAVARYRNGFLKITVPKKPHSEWRRLEVDFS
ncbi:MAG: Hsp20/alpha crystallin family protein [Peptococcaceae bacterium]|nr:Hsp20/alpha crystallin family protein [Peptococcaceae bacterium]